MTINPYQPAPVAKSTKDFEPSTELCFDGVIKREDYAALLPHGQLLCQLQAMVAATFAALA